MTVNVVTITDSDIEKLRSAAGQAGDFRQVGLCVIALDGEIDFDDYTVFDTSDRRFLQGFDQDSARAACVEAINDAAVAK